MLGPKYFNQPILEGFATKKPIVGMLDSLLPGPVTVVLKRG